MIAVEVVSDTLKGGMVTLLTVICSCLNWCLSLSSKWAAEKCYCLALSGNAAKEDFYVNMSVSHLVLYIISLYSSGIRTALTPWITFSLAIIIIIPT
jgi:hypothetical protein